jgi:AraC family transcriptional regulator, ethanolamine operon transcriptional activator
MAAVAPHVSRASPPTPVAHWTVAEDVDIHAANLAGWQQRYDQLSAGAFRGAIADLWFDDVQVFRERTSHAVRQVCAIRPGTVWCGVTLVHDSSRIEGHQVGANGVMVSGSPQPFELSTPDDHDILGIVVDRTSLQAVAQALGQPLDADAFDRPTWLACDAQAQAELVQGLRRLVDDGLSGQHGHHSARARRFAQHAVLGSLLLALAAPRADGNECLSFERRRRLVRAACDTVVAQADSAPTVPELCAMLHVSRRTLQYAFETVVGSSPVAYLRALRLNAVRRELCSGRADSVQDAAVRHGFWSLSQFASDYRAQFAERPSQTLLRSRAGTQRPLQTRTPETTKPAWQRASC